jgi:hypothetical protein
MAKCILCESDQIMESEDPEKPFYCGECGAWGMTATTVDNPDEDSEENWRFGQVPRRPVDE